MRFNEVDRTEVQNLAFELSIIDLLYAMAEFEEEQANVMLLLPQNEKKILDLLCESFDVKFSADKL